MTIRCRARVRHLDNHSTPGALGTLAPVRVESPGYPVRVRRASLARLLLRWAATLGALVVVLLAVVGLLFAGSSSQLASGVTVAGVDVGGLTAGEATRLLESRAAELAREPVTFAAADRRFAIRPNQLGVESDWAAAVAAARAEGDGFGPLRGLKRLHVRFFGAEITPSVGSYGAALEYKLGQLAEEIDRRHVEARLQRRGLQVVVVPGQSGQFLDRPRAATAIVAALASLDRNGPVRLPVRIDPVSVTAERLAPIAEQARVAMSAPVRLAYGETRWRLPRWRIAELLALPKGNTTKLSIAGPKADAYFRRLSRTVGREPSDATFAVTPGGIRVVPAREGLEVEVPRTAQAILTAALSRTNRVAPLAVVTAQPERSTADAKAMGITGLVGSYTTTYGGTPGRLHNVQLVSQLIDDHLIAPGAVFSFNQTTGERTAEKGFQEAPVIINGELQNGLGGGVCQVSTTVFNAAYEAGLPIVERWNHALYISHYPQGRDATVNYPDLDLKFRNDTGKWLLLRAFVGPGSLTINLYGTPQDRRVETSTGDLVVTGETPVERTEDPTLLVGESVTDVTGVPPRETSVTRRVYDSSGTLMFESTWSSSYVGEPTKIRVGTKKPEPKPAPPKAKDKDKPATTTTPTEPPAETTPAPTTPAVPT